MAQDPRKAVFDAIKCARGGKAFNQLEVGAIDNILDALNVPRDEPPKPKPAGAIPDDYWPMLAQIESGNRLYAKAPSSSASGLYQFIKATWTAEGGAWGNDVTKAFGGLLPSAEEQTRRARSFTARNATYLRSKGLPINKATLYAAHFFGAGMAAQVLSAPVDARADLIAGESATDANPSILKGKTVGQFLTWLHGKTGEWAR